MNQINDIKSHLEQGRTITPIEALTLYGCFRLAARVYELRKKGMDIDMEMVQSSKKSFAKYKLVS